MNNAGLLTDGSTAWPYVAIAVVGGVLGHMMRRRRARKRILLGEAVLQGSGAGFAGYLILLICRALEVTPEMSGVIVGLCGWIGADASLMLVQAYVYDKLKIGKSKNKGNGSF